MGIGLVYCNGLKGNGDVFEKGGGVGDGEAIAKGFNGLRKVRKKEKNNPITSFHNICDNY